jgi:DNA-binding NtrC family response regulator
VLLVAPSPGLAAAMVAWLAERNLKVTLVTSFAAAKARLEDPLSLLISEVRLGEHNGLHLAIHAQARSIPAIVIGDADPVLQRDAEQLSAAFLTYDADRSQLFRILDTLALDEGGDRPPAFSAIANLSFLSCNALGLPVSPASDLLPVGRKHLLGS